MVSVKYSSKDWSRLVQWLVIPILAIIGLVSMALIFGTWSAEASSMSQTRSQTQEQVEGNIVTSVDDAPSCDLDWLIVSSPNGGASENYLGGIDAVSADDIWAVGHYTATGRYRTLIEHWNGSAWSVVPSPSLGAYVNALAGVAVVSTNDVWAVGYYIDGPYRTLIEHWDGNAWSVVPSPNLGGTSNILRAITAISANDIWAVGYYVNAGASQTLILHWNGSLWAHVPSPNQGSNDNALYGVAAVSTNDVWAVGHYFNGLNIYRTLTMHWNGSAWSVAPSPSQGTGHNYIIGVAAVSANDVWAVGSAYGDNLYSTLTMHWDGISWSMVPSPNVGTGSNRLHRIAAVSANDVWAVGIYYNGVDVGRTLVQRWDGNAWSVVPSPSQGTRQNWLSAVTVVSAGDIWAVGSYAEADVYYQTLIERYNPCPLTPTPTQTSTGPTTTPTPSSTPDESPTACPIQFTDVPSNHTFYTYIRCLACRGIVGGYADGTFRPANDVTRGQIAKIVSNAAGFSEAHSTRSFEDIPTGHTFYPYIERLAFRGVIGGYACGGAGEPCGPANLPYFRSNNNASRGQLAKIVCRAYNCAELPAAQHFEDVATNHTFYTEIEQLYMLGAIGGYPCGGTGEPCGQGNRPYFRPGNNVSRGQITKIASNTFFPTCQAR